MKFVEGGYISSSGIRLDTKPHYAQCIYACMTEEQAKILGFNIGESMSSKQINVVINTTTSDDSNVQQRVNKALQELKCITYDELNDDIWAAIKLLQKQEHTN